MSQLTLQSSKQLFATPLYVFQLGESEALNRQLIADVEQLRRSAAPGITRSNQHGWHSERDFFRRPEASFRTLTTHIVQATATVTQRRADAMKVDVSKMQLRGNAWINVNEKGAYNTPHDHSGFLWSGCYYVKIPTSKEGRSGNIEFLSPRLATGSSKHERALLGGSRYRLEPKPGLMLIFPSYLQHWVYPNEEDETRISIAFNLNLIAQDRRAQTSASEAPNAS